MSPVMYLMRYLQCNFSILFVDGIEMVFHYDGSLCRCVYCVTGAFYSSIPIVNLPLINHTVSNLFFFNDFCISYVFSILNFGPISRYGSRIYRLSFLRIYSCWTGDIFFLEILCFSRNFLFCLKFEIDRWDVVRAR